MLVLFNKKFLLIFIIYLHTYSYKKLNQIDFTNTELLKSTKLWLLALTN